MIQVAHDKLNLIAGVITALGVILGVPPLRRLALIPFRWFKRVALLPDVILKEVRELVAQVKDLQDTVGRVDRQVNPNHGSSIPDGLKRIEHGVLRLDGRHKHGFIGQPRPAMEMDGDCSAVLLSGAMSRLFHADPETDLKGFSYLQFLDPARVDDFRESFKRVATAPSQPSAFRFAVEIFDISRDARGEWKWRAQPVGPRIGGEVLYTASLFPLDDLAREIATRNHWLV